MNKEIEKKLNRGERMFTWFVVVVILFVIGLSVFIFVIEQPTEVETLEFAEVLCDVTVYEHERSFAKDSAHAIFTFKDSSEYDVEYGSNTQGVLDITHYNFENIVVPSKYQILMSLEIQPDTYYIKITNRDLGVEEILTFTLGES